uniref:Putative secreted protein n=1 Tax=Anopheles darlingi TaxID=43151 RepID=A0A2M4D9U0_ANODA
MVLLVLAGAVRMSAANRWLRTHAASVMYSCPRKSLHRAVAEGKLVNLSLIAPRCALPTYLFVDKSPLQRSPEVIGSQEIKYITGRIRDTPRNGRALPPRDKHRNRIQDVPTEGREEPTAMSPYYDDDDDDGKGK